VLSCGDGAAGLAPDALAPDALAPDALAPDALAPDALAPDALAQLGRASGRRAHPVSSCRSAKRAEIG